MGCTMSYHYTVDRAIIGRNQECTDLLTSLSLETVDLDILFTAFTDIDADDSGTIRFDELFAYFHIEPTKFNETVFGYCDNDCRGYLTFLDFVIGIWLFLTVDQHELGGYAFILFDMDCTGILDCEEIINLIHIIHNKTTIQSQATLSVLQQLKLSKEMFTCEKFQQWTRTHLSLLEPAQTLQLNLRKNLIGENYWQQKTIYRKANTTTSSLEYIYNLKKQVYNIQKKQVLELLEERILLRKKDEFYHGNNLRKVPRGQRTTALLEYFNLTKGNEKGGLSIKERLGLLHHKKADHYLVNASSPHSKGRNKKELANKYRSIEEYEKEDRNLKQQSPSGAGAGGGSGGGHHHNHHHHHPHHQHQHHAVEKIPEGHESKEQESQKYPPITFPSPTPESPGVDDENGDEDNLDLRGLQSPSTLPTGAEAGVGAGMENVQFKDILICPEKQRRRRSSFLMTKPRLLLKSERAADEIKKKNSKKKGNKVLPAS